MVRVVGVVATERFEILRAALMIPSTISGTHGYEARAVGVDATDATDAGTVDASVT